MQTASKILMIEPVAFGYNEQTAANNYFQQKDNAQPLEIQQKALKEFTQMVETLCFNDVDVIVARDTPEPLTPDSIFPNNWISFHEDGLMALYPMFAPNRRAERQVDIVNEVINRGFAIRDIIDLTEWEKENKFLEGTGSMIFDRENRITYAALSPRTDIEVLNDFCQKMNFEPIIFHSLQTIDNQRLPVYHTNVMLSVGEDFAVVCLQSIDNEQEKDFLTKKIKETNKQIIEIDERQMHNFAGNLLQIQNSKGERLIALSQTAYNSLNNNQIKNLSKNGKLLPFSIPTIEKYGGGSVRCMMAEVF